MSEITLAVFLDETIYNSKDFIKYITAVKGIGKQERKTIKIIQGKCSIEKVSRILEKYPTINTVLLCGDDLCGDVLKSNESIYNKKSSFVSKHKALKKVNTLVSIKYSNSRSYAKANHQFLRRYLTAYLTANNIENEIEYDTEVIRITTKEQVDEIIEDILITGKFSVDAETNGKHFKDLNFELTGVGLSYEVGKSYFIFNDDYRWFADPKSEGYVKGIEEQSDNSVFKYFLDSLFELFYNPNIEKVLHNVKADLGFFEPYGLNMDLLCGRLSDTLLKHFLLYPTSKRHDLKTVLVKVFPQFEGYELAQKKENWEQPEPITLEKYCCVDADGTNRINTVFDLELLKEENRNLFNYYWNIYANFVYSIFLMTSNGIPVDRVFLREQLEATNTKIIQINNLLCDYPEVQKYITVKNQIAKDKRVSILNLNLDKLNKQRQEQVQKAKTEKAKDKAANKVYKREETYKQEMKDIIEGKELFTININSPEQLKELFYDKDDEGNKLGFGFKVPKHRGKDIRTVDKKKIKAFKGQSDFIDNFLLYKKYRKLRDTYLKGLDTKSIGDRYYPYFKIHGTETGRISSFVHTIPRNDSDGVYNVVKESIKPSKEGYVVVQVDFSQMELRIIAEVSEDPEMIRCYKEGIDLHVRTSAFVMGITVEEFLELSKDVAKQKRFLSKGINFGLCFGMMLNSFISYLDEQFNIKVTKKEAEKYFNDYHTLYSSVKKWHFRSVFDAKEIEGVSTLFGKFRPLFNINSQDKWLSLQEQRAAINTKIQGTAADYTNNGLNDLAVVIPNSWKMYNTVHDSIKFELPFTDLPKAKRVFENILERQITRPYFNFELQNVGLKVDIEYSKENESLLTEYK